MILITQTNLIEDTRKPGQAGMVIAEHIFADGQTWPAVFECAANEDVMERLATMAEQREAERNAEVSE